MTEGMLLPGDEAPAGAELYPCWKRVVELDAEPGNFRGGMETPNYTRTVTLEGDNLPQTMPDDPVYDISQTEQTIVFTGWYTQETTFKKTDMSDDSGEYWLWEIETHGEPLGAGDPVPLGVTTLYAGYAVKEDAGQMKEVTYYLDWNGINGMWGPCLSCTRDYDAAAGGYPLKAGDLAVWSLNWNGENGKDAPKFDSQSDLTTYWQGKDFNGYAFLGWAKSPEAEQPDVDVDKGAVVKQGESLYAVWQKTDDPEDNSWTFAKNGGRNVEIGPLEFMRFVDLRPSAHATEKNTVSVSLVGFPIGAEMNDLVWTLSFTDGTAQGAFCPYSAQVTEAEPFEGTAVNTRGESKEFGFTAKVSGNVLTITNNDGMDHGISVSATAKSVDAEGNPIDVVTPAEAVARFTHSWESVWDRMPNCTEHGQRTWTCQECKKQIVEDVPEDGHRFTYYYESPTCTEPGEDKRVCVVCGFIEDKTLPATGHQYQVTNVKMQGVMKITTELCSVCNEVEVIEEDTSIIKGDVNGDKKVDVMDSLRLFRYVAGTYTQPVNKTAADVNGDGVVDVMDSLRLFRFVAGVITSLG